MITSLMKMTAFRGIGAGDFIIARIVNIKGDYFLLEISGYCRHQEKMMLTDLR